jgi:hypothetical protein
VGNLTPFIEQQTQTVNLIYDWHVEQQKKQTPRGYLGGSVLGHECSRYLWYGFRGCFSRDVTMSEKQAAAGDHPGRIYRLFATGHQQEERFIEELRAIGCEVVPFGADGKQIGISMLAGHLKGHLDAMVLGVPEAPKSWHVGEFKTHNLKSFAKLKASGVKEARNEHWCQMQVYMGGTNTKRALYLAVCKDTDELYSERVTYDAKATQVLLDRGAEIIRASEPPPRIADRADDWRCRFCDAKTLCHNLSEEVAVPLPGVTCRTCCHATPVTDGEGGWRCEKHDCQILDTLVGADCPSHLLLPGIVDATPMDAGDNWIDYEAFRNGEGGFTSKALTTGLVLDESNLFVEDPPTGLHDSYPWQDSRRIWDGPVADLPRALASFDIPVDWLNTQEPKRTQINDEINAAEYGVGDHDYLIVVYNEPRLAAIWIGVS